MTRQPSKPSVKLVVLALAMAWLAGCSSNRTIEVPTAEVDESTPLDGDGNLAGTPAAVEAAIEKLDAENAQRAVTLANERAVAQSPDDLFERIRHGFSIEDVDHESVDRELNWYAKHPDYLDRTFPKSQGIRRVPEALPAPADVPPRAPASTASRIVAAINCARTAKKKHLK